MAFLSPGAHGAIDYVIVAAFLAAPWALSLSGLPSALCDVLAALHLTLALCTAYPAGVAKAIPFAAHGWIELSAGVIVALSPWIFGFTAAIVARDFFMVMAAVTLVVWAGTDYRAPIVELDR